LSGCPSVTDSEVNRRCSDVSKVMPIVFSMERSALPYPTWR
jgi:hypothetical protein